MGTWKAGKNGEAALDLKADHKFSLTGLAPTTGTWKLADDKVLLTIEQIGGMPVKTVVDQLNKAPGGKFQAQIDAISKPLESKLSEDRSTLSLTQPGGGTVTFTKA